MLIVADTTPIISLNKIGELGLLNSMFGEIILPEAVYNELMRNPLMSNEAEVIKKSSFLKIIKLKMNLPLNYFENNLTLEPVKVKPLSWLIH